MQVDEMIESIEVVKGGHVTGLVVQGLDGRVEKFVMPFDSVPPSLVVVNREGLVKLLSERLSPPQQPLTFEQLKERVGKPVWRKLKGTREANWVILSDVREIHSVGEVKREIKIAPHYIREYVGYNPALVEYYDHETREEK